MYDGDERPDSQIATIGVGGMTGPKSGTNVYMDGETWYAAIDTSDGRPCKGCARIVQVLPGNHVMTRSTPRPAGNQIITKQMKTPSCQRVVNSRLFVG